VCVLSGSACVCDCGSSRHLQWEIADATTQDHRHRHHQTFTHTSRKHARPVAAVVHHSHVRATPQHHACHCVWVGRRELILRRFFCISIVLFLFVAQLRNPSLQCLEQDVAQLPARRTAIVIVVVVVVVVQRVVPLLLLGGTLRVVTVASAPQRHHVQHTEAPLAARVQVGAHLLRCTTWAGHVCMLSSDARDVGDVRVAK
jgi:hypothetical protein